ncbi:hypothetical protein RRG08_041151 [Elysia crispata]|uniref:Antistasin-like domain-containing protein n=1 Tax=Elysia crispata TaxID=231223 RepID=A0AAE1CNZ1_9GAST|nr:hypothetical protein RRG08_041151 [Elysia crispata]
MLRCLFSTPGSMFWEKVLDPLVLTVMWTLHILSISAEGTTLQLDQSCSQKPLSCVMTQLGIPVRHTCERDSDCFPGKRCCFRGCTRTCVFWDPCETVVCNPGYTCQLRFSYHWTPEADCVPDEHELCKPLDCGEPESCPPGFKNSRDKDGCPTCNCEPKDDCRTSGCRLLCTFGLETAPNGCPVCRCKKAPDNPCSRLGCLAFEECRLVTPSDCSSPPCLPRPQCVPRPRQPNQFDNTCSSWDPSTVQFPVLSGPCVESQGHSDTCELDCRGQACPERTVCVRMGSVQNRCCWQATQALLLPAPKKGECPTDFLLEAALSSRASLLRPYLRCQLDAQCPGQQKCCSFNRYNSGVNAKDENGVVGKTLSVSGVCIDPSHKLLNELFLASNAPPP